MLALDYAITLLTELPALVKAGIDIVGVYNDGVKALKTMKEQGRNPTPQEWDELNSRIRTLREELHAGQAIPVNPPVNLAPFNKNNR